MITCGWFCLTQSRLICEDGKAISNMLAWLINKYNSDHYLISIEG
jgi:hypothetical protein